MPNPIVNLRVVLSGAPISDTTPGGLTDVWCWEAGIGMQWEAGINIQIN